MLAFGVPAAGSAATLSTSTCHLAAPYQHVIYIQYDNTHLSRDNPNVPSDLEQVPALKNFLTFAPPRAARPSSTPAR